MWCSIPHTISSSISIFKASCIILTLGLIWWGIDNSHKPWIHWFSNVEQTHPLFIDNETLNWSSFIFNLIEVVVFATHYTYVLPFLKSNPHALLLKISPFFASKSTSSSCSSFPFTYVFSSFLLIFYSILLLLGINFLLLLDTPTSSLAANDPSVEDTLGWDSWRNSRRITQIG